MLRAAATPQPRTDLKTIQSEVSIVNIEATLHAIDVDRTGGSQGERQAFEYLAQRLREYGVKHTTHEARQLHSWPGRSELTLAGGETIVGQAGGLTITGIAGKETAVRLPASVCASARVACMIGMT